jgi:hypothetical protein
MEKDSNKLLLLVIAFLVTFSASKIPEKMGNKIDMLADSPISDENYTNANGAKYLAQLKQNYLQVDDYIDFTIDTFANKKQSYDGDIDANFKITFETFVKPAVAITGFLEKVNLNKPINAEIDIPEWLNLFVFEDAAASKNLMSYMKYKRGLLTAPETQALKATLCPASQKEKIYKSYFYRIFKMSIKEFKNMGHIFILDSSTLCVDEKKQDSDKASK